MSQIENGVAVMVSISELKSVIIVVDYSHHPALSSMSSNREISFVEEGGSGDGDNHNREEVNIGSFVDMINNIAMPAEENCRIVLDRLRAISADYRRMVDYAAGELIDMVRKVEAERDDIKTAFNDMARVAKREHRVKLKYKAERDVLAEANEKIVAEKMAWVNEKEKMATKIAELQRTLGQIHLMSAAAAAGAETPDNLY